MGNCAGSSFNDSIVPSLENGYIHLIMLNQITLIKLKIKI